MVWHLGRTLSESEAEGAAPFQLMDVLPASVSGEDADEFTSLSQRGSQDDYPARQSAYVQGKKARQMDRNGRSFARQSVQFSIWLLK